MRRLLLQWGTPNGFRNRVCSSFSSGLGRRKEPGSAALSRVSSRSSFRHCCTYIRTCQSAPPPSRALCETVGSQRVFVLARLAPQEGARSSRDEEEEKEKEAGVQAEAKSIQCTLGIPVNTKYIAGVCVRAYKVLGNHNAERGGAQCATNVDRRVA